MMKLTFLGTGTSHGIPVIGCQCQVCNSKDPKDKRMRSSVLLTWEGQNILVDTAVEFRLQALREGLRDIDAVLYTHAHADHMLGFDDLRRFNHFKGGPIPCYGSPQTIQSLQKMFSYAFSNERGSGVRPAVKVKEIKGPFTIASLNIIPVPVMHGFLPIYGYRFGDLAYITDCSYIPPSSLPLLSDLKILILGVLRYRPHKAHLSLEEGLEIVETLKPKRAYFTHLCHVFLHVQGEKILPSNVKLAYDGLKICIQE